METFLLKSILDSEVVAKMAPTRVTVVEETLAEPKVKMRTVLL